MEKVLITGVAGFIGANFAMKLLRSDKEIQVIGIDNLNDYYDVDKNGIVQIIKNNDINTLTLITCKKNTDKQTVFIFELNKEGKL